MTRQQSNVEKASKGIQYISEAMDGANAYELEEISGMMFTLHSRLVTRLSLRAHEAEKKERDG